MDTTNQVQHATSDLALICLDNYIECSSAPARDHEDYSLAEFLKIKGREFEEKWIAQPPSEPM